MPTDQHAGTGEGAIAKLQRLKEQKAKRIKDAKIADIKRRVSLRKPEYKFEIPELPPREGTKEYQRWLNPWRNLGQSSPGFKPPLSPVKVVQELKSEKNGKKKKKKKSGVGDSDDDSDDDDDDGSIASKKSLKKAFEDFVIPDVVDAQTGKSLSLTKSFWSSEEGAVHYDTQGILDRQTGRLDLLARPDSSAFVIDTNTVHKAFSGNSSKSKSPRKGGKSVRISGTETSLTGGSITESNDSSGRPSTEDRSSSEHPRLLRSDGGTQHNGSGSGSGSGRRGEKRQQGLHRHHSHSHGAHNYTAPTVKPKLALGQMAGHTNRVMTKEGVAAADKYAGTTHQDTGMMGVAEHHHNSLHHLHLGLHGKAAKNVHVHHHNDEVARVVTIKTRGVHHEHHHAKREMNDLVAHFLKDGPLKPMYHVHWDRASDTIAIPEGYVNDEDGDANDYLSYTEEVMGSGRSTKSESEASSSEDESAADNSPRASDISSIGYDSIESNAELGKAKRKKKGGLPHKEILQLDGKEQEEGDKDGDGDIESTATSKVSILSDALNPENTVTWRALEDRYYREVRDLAVEYETNKLWTKEKPVEGGPHGMDIKCRDYASWKARCVRFIVHAVDDEKDKDDARIALEDELEIKHPERLLETVKKHNVQRHNHRTYINTFKYDMEILNASKLYELGLVW